MDYLLIFIIGFALADSTFYKRLKLTKWMGDRGKQLALNLVLGKEKPTMHPYREWIAEERKRGNHIDGRDVVRKLHELYPKGLPEDATGGEIYLYNNY